MVFFSGITGEKRLAACPRDGGEGAFRDRSAGDELFEYQVLGLNRGGTEPDKGEQPGKKSSALVIDSSAALLRLRSLGGRGSDATSLRISFGASVPAAIMPGAAPLEPIR
ncbi:hypothetical protein ACFSKM_13090 [Ancylobacter dichloromethanicus]